MMKKLIIICLIVFAFPCDGVDTRPKYISDVKKSSYQLEYIKESGPKNLRSSFLQANSLSIEGRNIPTSDGMYTVNEYQKITIVNDTLRFEVTQNVITVLPENTYYPYYPLTIGAIGFSKMEIVEATIEPKIDVVVSFDENSKSFGISGKFFNGYNISLRYVYITTNNNLFYKSQYVTVGGSYGICKVSFEAEGDSVILGTKNNYLPFDGKKIYYSQSCPEEDFTDYVIITRYAAKWSSYYSRDVYASENYKGYAELAFPRLSLGGNNFIIENNITTPYVNYIDNYYVKNNGTHYIVNYNKPRKGTLKTNTNVIFVNSIDNEFVFPMDESLIDDTSTENTKAKAKEILKTDMSNDPDHIKLGKWVTNNMNYNIRYSGKKMTVDEILSSLTGVCEHFTKLYNALLFSIGIKAVYLSGFAITGEDGIPEEAKTVPHAWTMAKIDGKWKAFDSTWGLYFDKFPISHVFANNFGISYAVQHNTYMNPYDSEYDTTFSNLVSIRELSEIKEQVEEALFIREENVKTKVAYLNKKEKELDSREASIKPTEEKLSEKEKKLNNTESELLIKEKELNQKEADLNNTKNELLKKQEELSLLKANLSTMESQLANKETELKNKEKELNETEYRLNTKDSELYEKEILLNETELSLNKKKYEFNKREIALNETESLLNIKEQKLKEKEDDLNEKKTNLTSRENELNVKENNLYIKEDELTKKEYNLTNKENELNNIEYNLTMKENGLNRRERNIIFKEDELNKTEYNLSIKDNYLNGKENELNRKEYNLTVRENILTKIETNLTGTELEVYIKENNLIIKEDELNKKETNLTNKENILNNKENTLSTKEDELNTRENKVSIKENELNIKENNLTNIETELNKKESNIKIKENELTEKEITINEKENNITKKEYEIHSKESDLNTKEKNNQKKEEELVTKEESIKVKEDNLIKRESDIITKENSLNEQETVLNEKGESTLTGLIVVCILLGISIIINIWCCIKRKKSSGNILDVSTNNSNEKMRELM